MRRQVSLLVLSREEIKKMIKNAFCQVSLIRLSLFFFSVEEKIRQMNSFLLVLEYGKIEGLAAFKPLACSHDKAVYPKCGRLSDCRLLIQYILHF